MLYGSMISKLLAREHNKHEIQPGTANSGSILSELHSIRKDSCKTTSTCHGQDVPKPSFLSPYFKFEFYKQEKFNIGIVLNLDRLNQFDHKLIGTYYKNQSFIRGKKTIGAFFCCLSQMINVKPTLICIIQQPLPQFKTANKRSGVRYSQGSHSFIIEYKIATTRYFFVI